MSARSGLTLSRDQVVLVMALIKVGFMASFATVLCRFDTFKRMYFQHREGVRGRVYFIALMGAVFCFGVGVRVLLGYGAVDMSFEGALLSGLVAGPIVGMSVGALVGLPPLAVHEFAALPVAVGFGLAGGIYHTFFFRRGQRISFSPITLILGRVLWKKGGNTAELKRDLSLLVTIFGLELCLYGLTKTLDPQLLYVVWPDQPATLIALMIGMAAAIAVPLMIWDHIYVEMVLEERDRGLTQARLDALKSRIQPHFLFNTLNTIAATIRIDPTRARVVVIKLSQILRAILDASGDYRSLEQEVGMMDDYLEIERARFGDDQIRFEKQIDPTLLNVPIPTLLLQPIVENSVVHGLRSKKGGSTIRLNVRRSENDIEIVIEDDGVGMTEARLRVAKNVGIGVSNVEERLRVLYGSNFRFEMESEPGKGTRSCIVFPLEAQEFPKAANA